ncbi:MAG TPA: serine/threonine-protein kinase [Gemmatimonadales bacterium]|nr:serine/threonine-protein kinase [Gemmatimonadales bacterium]
MTDIAGTPLDLALRGRYRLLRELGQGGMATVYLAEDLKHHRKVAVKVLRPELAESLGPQRFLREIEIAAQLTHPHILPLHDSGEAGGFLYYVMPYVEGESLRARLARDGALPPPEAARYLRDVADALAYAHARGVVHRDVKPENVMLAGRHALVMDFGVAKAVSEAGAAGLTTVGVTLGTPSYMSPEQAVASPTVDHRTDIYALGIMAYEMLAGRTPFEGMGPQQVLAAHVTRAPEPLAARVPGLPPALAALVMRCLEKQPEARPESAAELVPLLEGAESPSGGAAAAPATAAFSSGAERAIRRAHPARVALLFASAAVVVLAVVWVLMLRLGLPDWVLGVAAALLAVGLPIMLLTGVHERRRAVARTTAALTPPETVVSRWFTWKRAVLGGGLAFAGLTAAVAAYTAMRLLGIGPVGTLVASGVLKERERLVLADFENHTPDSTLGTSLTEAFRVDLSQSPTLRLVDGGEIGDALARMQRTADGRLPPALARELAERIGSKAVVTGQIDPVGTGYVLSASLVSAADGQVLTAVRETADDAAGLLKAIDRLSGKLRERIGESLVTIRANPPLERVTTRSLPALRKYSDAERLVDQARESEAIPLLEEAIALDTGFAMAYRKLAVALGNIRESDTRVNEAATQAFRRRDRLPDLERELATAFYYSQVDYDPTRVETAYRTILAADPDNATALNNLALALNMQKRWSEAESLAVRGTRVSHIASLVQHVVWARLAQGHIAEARAAVETFAKSEPPTSGTVREQQALVALAEGDYAAAIRLYEELRREHAADPSRQSQTSWMLARLAELRGRLGEAAEHLRDYMSEGEARGLPRDYLDGAAALGMMEIQYRNRPGAALAIVEKALARVPLDSLPPADRPYLPLARVYAAAGNAAAARRLMREYEAAVPPGYRRGAQPVIKGMAYGAVAEAEGRLDEAAAGYRAAYDDAGYCNSCGLFDLARIAERAGRADSALALYRRFADTPLLVATVATNTSGALAPAYKRLGELYEAKGDRRQAAEYYERFVNLWKDADPELQPGVREVRGRLARLAQEPGT